MPDRLMDRLTAADPITRQGRVHDAVPSAAELLARWETGGAVDAQVSAPSTEAGRRPWRDQLAAWLVSGVLIAVVGTASAAAALTALTGSPLPLSGDAFTVSPKPGTTRLSPVRAADPDGGPPWAVRLGAADAGLVCLGVGQVQGGALGLVGLDGVFRRVPPVGADDCGAPPTSSQSTVQTRTLLGAPRTNAVTVIYGLRAPDGISVRVRYADGMTKVLPVAPDGSFIVARRGNLAAQHPQIEVGLRDDKLERIDLAPSSAAERRFNPERPLLPSEAPR